MLPVAWNWPAQPGPGAVACGPAAAGGVEACRAAMRGEKFVYSGARTPLITDFLHRARQDMPVREDPLSPREQEILKLVAEGYTNKQIAETLVISEKTVERHRANILEKLGMRDRVELTRYAIRHGLIEP